jgi:hypothetical protein
MAITDPRVKISATGWHEGDGPSYKEQFDGGDRLDNKRLAIQHKLDWRASMEKDVKDEVIRSCMRQLEHQLEKAMPSCKNCDSAKVDMSEAKDMLRDETTLRFQARCGAFAPHNPASKCCPKRRTIKAETPPDALHHSLHHRLHRHQALDLTAPPLPIKPRTPDEPQTSADAW